MDIQTKIDLIKRPPTEEILVEQELKQLLETNEHPQHYQGFEISGLLHLGNFLVSGFKINDFIKAGISCQAFLADSTTPEERGRVAGLAILASFVLVILSFLVVLVLRLESTGILLASVGIKSIGFLSFILDPIDKKENKARSWRSILNCKNFRLY